MRARTAAILLLALAACSVKLEGAACTGDDNCPGGQRCGVDGKCSQAAAACPGTPTPAKYPPPPSLNCQSGEKYCGDDGSIVTCVVDDALCSHFPGTGGTNCDPGVCDVGSVSPACRSKYYVALSIDAPAAGTLVGPTGVTVTATLTLSSLTVPVPTALELQAQGLTVALANPVRNLLAVTYSGAYTPSPADATVSLSVVAAKGTVDEISASRDVAVDTRPPVISNVYISCPNPCLRDSTLTVHAAVSDTHPAGVSALVSLASAPIPLTGTSGSYSGTFPVKDVAFPYFSTGVTAQVTASDLAGNTATTAAPAFQVTRVRWVTTVETTFPPSLTGAAVDASGNVYVGASNGNVYVLTPAGAKAKTWPVATNIAAAPSVGAAGVWVASQSGTVYLLDSSTGIPLNGSGCAPVVGAISTTPALEQLAVETAFVGSQTGVLIAAALTTPTPKCTNSGSYEPFYASLAIDGSNNVYAASDQGRLRSLKLDTNGLFAENWASPGYVSVGASVRVPLTMDGTTVWSASNETTGKIFSTTSAGTATQIATGGVLTDPIILANGDIVAGDEKALRRWTATGTVIWTSSDLAATVVSAMAIAGGDASFLVPTADGKLHALKTDGSVLWEGPLTAGAALREGNVFKLAGDTFSTAVFGAADGKVYAVLVDGALDTSAKWPKVHHDTRNTGNASASLP